MAYSREPSRGHAPEAGRRNRSSQQGAKEEIPPGNFKTRHWFLPRVLQKQAIACDRQLYGDAAISSRQRSKSSKTDASICLYCHRSTCPFDGLVPSLPHGAAPSKALSIRLEHLGADRSRHTPAHHRPRRVTARRVAPAAERPLLSRLNYFGTPPRSHRPRCSAARIHPTFACQVVPASTAGGAGEPPAAGFHSHPQGAEEPAKRHPTTAVGRTPSGPSGRLQL